MLNILLIEETAADATIFIDQLQNFAGRDINVVWHQKLQSALALLESGQAFDQIWLDPELSDLTADIAKALAHLKRFVPPGEVRLIGQNFSPDDLITARKQHVDVVSTSNNRDVIEIVAELLKRRSSNGTTRVEMARTEGALARLEWQVTQMSDMLKRTTDLAARNQDLIVGTQTELVFVKDLAKKIPDLESIVAAIKSGREEKQKIQFKRWELIVALITTLVVALVGPVLLKLLDRSPSPSPSPAKSQQTTPGGGKTM